MTSNKYINEIPAPSLCSRIDSTNRLSGKKNVGSYGEKYARGWIARNLPQLNHCGSNIHVGRNGEIDLLYTVVTREKNVSRATFANIFVFEVRARLCFCLTKPSNIDDCKPGRLDRTAEVLESCLTDEGIAGRMGGAENTNAFIDIATESKPATKSYMCNCSEFTPMTFLKLKKLKRSVALHISSKKFKKEVLKGGEVCALIYLMYIEFKALPDFNVPARTAPHKCSFSASISFEKLDIIQFN